MGSNGRVVRGADLATCKRCGCWRVVWVQSKRTGRYYLASTMPSQREGDWFVVTPWQPHSCEKWREAVAELDRGASASTAGRERTGTCACRSR